MPTSTMFSKLRSGGGGAQTPVESNPIGQYFEIGKQVANAGPELVWKIHDAYRKSDGKECSIFIFEKRCAEKLHKPKRKETVTEILRNGVKELERYRHPKVLHVLHSVEECPDTLAFASEPVYASLANILAFHEAATVSSSPGGTQQQTSKPGVFQREYTFLDMEYKYGILQITEALSFLHFSGHVIHRNVCPGSILVTKRGTWKLSGLEFTEKVNDIDGIEPVSCQPWTSRLSKMAQPNLDYMAPESQTQSICSILSDMFSLGMVLCAIFNQGRPLIQANNSSSSYLKQLELLEDQVHNILPRVPIPLQEATVRLLSKDTRQRPTAQLLVLIKYFDDPTVHALQYLDTIMMKDPTQKNHFYRNTLKDALPYIPKKLWYQHVWPSLQQEMRSQEVLASVLQPVLFIVQESTVDEYESVILPSLRTVFQAPKTVQAAVTILENLHIILEKTPREDIKTEVLPMLFSAFDSTTIQVQNAALIAVTNISEYLDENVIKRTILPKTKIIYEKNQNDLKLVSNVLSCIERSLDRLDKSQIIDEIMPLLYEIRLSDPMVILRVVNIYRLMLSDKKYGLSVNLMATKVMPSLLPQTVNPSLNLEQFTVLIEVLQDMLDQIDRNQRNKLKLDNLSLPSPERHRPLRHQYSSDNMHVAPFNIPNLRIEQRKTSSAEDMQRKNSTGGILGGWWFGGSPSSPDSNFLRVANAFPNRRLSDNTLMTPKIRIAPSCASSPGGTPGGGLPIRRHSSIGPQERRGSTVNLSPPTGGSMPNTSSSVPFLLSSSMQSIRSRRPSAALGGSQGGSSGLLQQLGSGMATVIRYVDSEVTKERRQCRVRKHKNIDTEEDGVTKQMTLNSYPTNTEEVAASEASEASGGSNSSSSSSTDVYPLPLFLGQTEIVQESDDGEGALVTEFPDSNLLTGGSNFSFDGCVNVNVGHVFKGDVVVNQYVNGADLPQIQNGDIPQDEIQCNKNVHVVPPPVPIDKPTAGAGLFRRHFKAIMILLTVATVICAATLITLRLVGSKKPSYVTTTTTTEKSTTTVSPNPLIHYPFNKTQWGGRVLPNQDVIDEPVLLVIIKHTKSKSCQDLPSCFTAMQNLQNSDVGIHHLRDIRYNFVVGGDGNIYEGRGWGVRNEQMNNTIDIAYMGDYNEQVPSEWLAGTGKVWVLQGILDGHLSYSNTRVVCHNQTEDTDSPGVNLYREVIKWQYYSDEIINASSWKNDL